MPRDKGNSSGTLYIENADVVGMISGSPEHLFHRSQAMLSK